MEGTAETLGILLMIYYMIELVKSRNASNVSMCGWVC